ncbi:MAG: DUF998 domain-containing protein [Thermoanaerobaculia bacterium]|nr:DUF998 domain-containing protein [Thermoanaerobaculia bacterium]MBP9825204.1 DUF998 domain-containing protein [Thermoanaerobaculia bacterium]
MRPNLGSATAGRAATLCGLLGAFVALLFPVLGAAGTPGYRHASQYISELGAFGAPQAQLVNWAGFLPAGILMTLFAWFAWRALPASPAATLGLAGLALFALGYVAVAFFPCEPGCLPAESSLSQTLHNLLGLAGYITAPPALFALGWAARSWPGARYLATLGFVGGGLALAGLLGLSPDFAYVGLSQRLLEGSVLGWVVACSLHLRHRPAATS